jgi:phospholipid/cholesterol/gamma-HCH transport system permease protein
VQAALPTPRPNFLLRHTDAWGAGLLRFLSYLGSLFLLAYASARATLVHGQQSRRSILSVLLMQIYFTGVQALPLVTVLGLVVGGVVILNASALSFLADLAMIANLLIVVVVRELGPLIIALILTARSGTAIAAEIGNMRVNKEIEALETMAINPLSFIVFPRLAGGVISIVCLTFYFNAIALIGGYGVTRLFHDLPFNAYTEALSEALSVRDVTLFLTKNFLNGACVFTISCYQGLQVKGSPHEVPQATTKAVIVCIIAITATTLLATLLFYLEQLLALVG